VFAYGVEGLLQDGADVLEAHLQGHLRLHALYLELDLLVTELGEAIEGTDLEPTVVRIGITGGAAVSRIPGGFSVPKVDLVGAPLVLMQNDRLHVAESLKLQPTLVKELLNFRRKININTSNATYEAWREGDHDDLVLSLALGTWAGQNLLRTREYVRAPAALVPDAPIVYRGG